MRLFLLLSLSNNVDLVSGQKTAKVNSRLRHWRKSWIMATASSPTGEERRSCDFWLMRGIFFWNKKKKWQHIDSLLLDNLSDKIKKNYCRTMFTIHAKKYTYIQYIYNFLIWQNLKNLFNKIQGIDASI